jgi:hypothetical protein
MDASGGVSRDNQENIMTALLIALSTAVVCLSVALWRSRQTIRRQTCEIGALQMTNYELRGQAAELATLAHEAQAMARKSAGDANFYASKANEERLKVEKLDGMLRDCCDRELEALHQWESESSQHAATKRTLATTRAWVTRLRK